MAVILVIDDERGIRELLDTFLRQKGHDVVLAASGREGLKVFRRERPDVVVLDLNMPGIDGLTILQEIRNLHPSQPVVILTEAGTAEEKQQVRALGVTEYIVKQFALHLLGDSLNRLLISTSPSA